MNWNVAPPESTFQNAKRANRQARILNCPSSVPFLQALVRAVLSGEIWKANPPKPEELLDLTIYLPSRTAVEPLKLAFLSASPNGASFLPRIRVLGQVNPIDLFAAFGTKIAGGEIAINLLRRAVDVPLAFDELERRLHLTAHVLKAAEALQSTKVSPDERLFVDIAPSNAFGIAGRLSRLIDEAQSEGVDLGRLQFLDAGDVSNNEQLALQLLRAVIKNWKSHKTKIGKIDLEERRNALMALEAEFIERTEAPVIVAGSTASVAATLDLMQAVLARKNNAIMLSGLDRHLNEESWASVADSPEHPQHALHRLLSRFCISRDEVGELARPEAQWSEDRASFLSEALRPAATTKEWQRFINTKRKRTSAPDQKLTIIEAENIPEEADIISLILRGSLEKPGQTAALITPDEKLAKRVRNNLARWNIGVADAANARTTDRFPGQVAACAASGKAEDLIALLRHAPGDISAPFRRFAEIMDLGALRQMWRPSRFENMPAALSRAAFAVATGDSRHPAMKRVGGEKWDEARFFAERIVEAFFPLTQIATQQQPLMDWIAHHGDVLSRLADLGVGATTDENKNDSLLSELKRFHLPHLSLDLAGYAALFDEVFNAQAISQLPDPHPRLFFWRPLDARLLSADLIVLAGMNEGCWPQSLEPDPWLSRRDRAVLGLSMPERRIGQTAQDFASLAASAAQVYITRSRTLNGSLARPSRWISRMKTLAHGAPHLRLLDDGTRWASIARLLREPDLVESMKRPEPRPPLAARPRRLSVTAIETWFANPYAIYARHILRLEPLRGFEEGCDARDKGILIHAALHSFLEKHKVSLPPNTAECLVEELDKTADSLGFDLARAPFWRPRFERFAHWFADAEKTLREGLLTLKSEVSGKLTLPAPAGPFEITARADRIDVRADGSLRILDFKTSVNTAQQSLARGAPQLALEGLLAREGAFAGVKPGKPIDLAYITATGGEPAGEMKPLKDPADEAIQSARIGTMNLIARFDDPVKPYHYGARSIFKDKARYDPYSHLARVQEWAGDGTTEDESDE